MRVETIENPLFEMPKPFSVWMYGGGTQSAAIAALILLGKIPKPDLACIADTGREKQTTWDYLENVIQPALPFKIHRISKEHFATVDLYALNGDLLIPAYTNQSGEISKFPAFCSNEWKTRVCARWLTSEGYTAWQSWIGYSFEEVRRWRKAKANHQENIWLPLVDGVESTRAGCVSIVQGMGWPKPPRSACFICSNMRDDEWAELSPEDLEKACQVDEQIRQKDPHVFLHWSCKPLREVVFQPKHEMATPCDTGGCMT